MKTADNNRAAGLFQKSKVAGTALALGIGLSALFGGKAEAGALYDQCLTFVVDISSSTKPHGYEGQMKGIVAGLRDSYVVNKIGKMHTGMKATLIMFSTEVRVMATANLHDAQSVLTFAQYLEDMKSPFDGNNNLLGALQKAEEMFDAVELGGEGCITRTIDFSGDGAHVGAPHALLSEQVVKLAQKGVTINGLSFNDIRWAKFTTPFDGYQNIHDYYARVIVTPPGLGVRPGMHFPINNKPTDTVAAIVAEITETMRIKVRDEITDISPLEGRPVRHAALRP